MDINLASQIASIVGLGISLITLYRVWDIRRAIASQNLSKSIHQGFEEALQFPSGKRVLTPSNLEKVTQTVIYVELFVVTRWTVKHWNARKLLKKLKAEIKSERRTDIIKTDLTMLRDQLFTFQ